MELSAGRTEPFITRRFGTYYTALFTGFGVVIALLTSFVNYRLDTTDIHKKLFQNAEAELTLKEYELRSYTEGYDDLLVSIKESSLLNQFILESNATNRSHATDLLATLASADPSIMQLRYIDQTGKEQIRINRMSDGDQVEITPPENLQDKSHRYYFKEASQLSPLESWVSRLDLNIENNQLELPIRSVLRKASAIHINGQPKGIVIVNAHANQFLQRLCSSSQFTISIVDRDGYYLTDYLPERSWSRYLGTGYTVETVHGQTGRAILQSAGKSGLQDHGMLFSASISAYLPKDGAILIIEPRETVIKSMERERKKAAALIVLIIIVLSLPLSLIIARAPALLNKKVLQQNAVLTEYFDLLDTNVIACSTDIKGTFLDVSSAFASISGYKKAELIGQNYSMLYHPGEKAETYEAIWQTLMSGKIWHGEMHHRDKNGEAFWTEVSIHPKRDKTGKVAECSAIHQPITYRKRIEQLSVTDELTGLYNRRFFNLTIARELNRAQRDSKLLSFAMLDVDFFKQYNDHYGHLKGDEVLTTIGLTLKRMLSRGSDHCFRLGGEEFGIIIVDLLPAEALRFIEEIREAIQHIGIEHRWSEASNVVTVSAGLLSVTPGPGVTVDAVYRKADEALYQAKRLGRNQVVPALLDAKV